jgi:hypothetical protein
MHQQRGGVAIAFMAAALWIVLLSRHGSICSSGRANSDSCASQLINRLSPGTFLSHPRQLFAVQYAMDVIDQDRLPPCRMSVEFSGAGSDWTVLILSIVTLIPGHAG